MNWGICFIFDYGTAVQNEESRQQFEVNSLWKPRDFRFGINGKFKTKRPITYITGIMYDGPTQTWFPRETGIQIEFPELWGNLWVGLQKEGLSQSKIAVGRTGTSRIITILSIKTRRPSTLFSMVGNCSRHD